MNRNDFRTIASRICRMAVASTAALGLTATVHAGPPLIDPETGETILPRYMTDAERIVWEANPPIVERGVSPAPIGPVHCVAEYEPMEGIIITWEGGGSLTSILTQMALRITTIGNARVYVACDSPAVQSSANTALTNAGVDMSRVSFIQQTMDSIWVRDYGPRYIYEGDCRAIVDHVYNRPRPNDNVFPVTFGNTKRHARYPIPLVHGGGNYHLSRLGDSASTRLITNENPSLPESEIHDIWAEYQSLDTSFFTPFPNSIDLTQHIDMWMQIFDDRSVMISDWPNNVGSTQDVICDGAAVEMAARGYTVHRIPARHVSGVHYTYTNVVICNDLVLVPSYTNATVSPHNAAALAAWQAAMPNHTVVQLNCQNIVSLAGVMHCIVMHVPAHRGGTNPTVHLRTLRGGEVLAPGASQPIEWISDDDVSVSNIDILLSTDGGATFPTTITAATADDGSFVWTVPNVASTRARIRLVARDGASNTGSTESPADFTINGTPPNCPPDVNGDGSVNLTDLSILLSVFGLCDGASGYVPAADIDGGGCVNLSDLSILLAAFGSACP